MLQLTLIRHAKSSWGDPELSDIDRPLNERGFRDAAKMGDILKDRLAPIDLFVSSPAKRALTTSVLLTEKLGYPETGITQEQRLYDASLPTLLKIIQALDSLAKHCVLVAHNPGLSQLADYLDNGQTGDLPTSAVVSLTFEVESWSAVDRNSGRVALFEYPKKHR